MVLAGQVEQAQKELIEKKTRTVLDVEDPAVRKQLGIPLDGFDMGTRTFINSKATKLATTTKDRIGQSI